MIPSENPEPATRNPQLPDPQPGTRNSQPVTPGPELVTRNSQLATSRLIVVAEDDEGVNRLVCKGLQRHGFKSAGVFSGADAIALLRKHRDCLLLLDYALPDMNGREVLDKLRELGLRVPFIVVTGHGDEQLAVELMKLGARDYLVKQVDFTDMLVPVVERVLAQIATEEQLVASEQALRENENVYRTLAESIPGLVYRCDLKQGGVMRFMNDQLVPMTGYGPDELQAGTICSIEPLIIEPDRAGVVAEVERAIADDRPFIVEYRLKHKDGSERFFVERGRPVRGADGRPSHIDGVIFDVTKSRQAELALHESEEKYRNVVERANDGIIIVQDGVLRFANQRMAELDGTSVERLIGTPFTDHVHPDELPRLTETYRRRMAGEDAPHIYETLLRRADGSPAPSELNAGVVTFEGRPADMIVVRDITERKQAEATLRESEERYRHMVELSPAGILVVDLKGTVTSTNEAFIRLSGFPAEELVGRHITRLPTLVGQDTRTYLALFSSILKGKLIGPTEFKWRHADGSTRVGEGVVSLLRDDRRVTGAQVIVTDITERKQAEQTLRTTVERFDLMLSHMPIGVLVTNGQDRVEFVNHVFCDMFGIAGGPASLVGLASNEAVPKLLPAYADPGGTLARIRALLTGTAPAIGEEVLMRDGRVMLVDFVPIIVGGTKAGRLWIHRDITESKRAATTLRESEERFSKAFRSAPYAVTLTRLADGRIVDVNDAFTSMTGWQNAEAVGQTTPGLRLWGEQQGRDRIAAELTKNGRVASCEQEFRKKNGDMLIGLFAAEVIAIDGEQHVLSTISDITERKRAEQALRESEERLKEAQSLGRIGSWEFDLDHQTIEWSDEVYRLYERDKSLGPPSSEEEASYYSRDDVLRLRGFARQATEEGRDLTYDVTVNLPSGRRVFLAARMRPIKDQTGRVVKLFGTVHDITERKQAETALMAERERAQKYLEIAGVMLVALEESGRITLVNRHGSGVLGYDEGELLGKSWFDTCVPERMRNETRGVFNWLMVGAVEPVEYYENAVVTRSGEERLIAWHNVVLRDESGRAVGTLSSGEDITERRQTEQALKASEVLHRTLFESATDALFLMDGYRFSECNAATLTIFGCRERGDIVGRCPWDFSPARQVDGGDSHARAVEMMDAALAGQPQRVEWLHARLDGTTFLAEVVLNRVEFGGRPRLLAAVRDITERKQIEMALQESEERFRKFSQTAPDAIVMADDEGQVDFWNEAAERMFGCNREDALGQPLPELVAPPALRDRFRAGIASFAHTGTGPLLGRLLQFNAMRHDGSEFPVELTMSAMQLRGRWHSIGTIRDITERKQAEERDRQHLKDTTLLRDTALGFIQLAPDADIYQYVADRLSRLVGEAYIIVNSYDSTVDQFAVRAIAGIGARLETVLKVTGRKPVGTVFTLEPEHRSEYASERLLRFEDGIRGLSYGKLPGILTQTIEKTFDIGGVYAMGIHLQGRILGTVNIVMRRGADIHDPGVVETFVNQAAIALQHRDDADELDRHRVHLEDLVAERTRELTVAQGKLVQQEKLATVGRVAGSVAHELRNPLGAIRNASYFLRTTVADKLKGKPLRHLQIIEEHVERANRAITMILDFTQGRTAEPDLCELQPILERAITEANVPPTVEVLIAAPPSLPRVFVDAAQIAVVFRNLVTNAAQAMPDGGKVRIQARAGQDEVVVDVTDAGMGIRPEHMASLFRPLFTTKDIGVGLGLAICKGFIEANKGTISVASEVGRGTTFTITLPAAKGGDPPIVSNLSVGASPVSSEKGGSSQ